MIANIGKVQNLKWVKRLRNLQTRDSFICDSLILQENKIIVWFDFNIATQYKDTINAPSSLMLLDMKTMKIKITTNPLLTHFARHDSRTNEDIKVVCQHVDIVESIGLEPFHNNVFAQFTSSSGINRPLWTHLSETPLISNANASLFSDTRNLSVT